uniref:Uncharacterized protein n=1 Tax=Arundo donax TaxID=35708 RepID=A0A0A9E8P0_ARUDO
MQLVLLAWQWLAFVYSSGWASFNWILRSKENVKL